jgi:DHA1 family bicyclomycin/chloramphenicol resistance-like MFS transporter
LGFVGGNASALAVQQSRDVAGSGSGLGGGLMFLAAGLVSPFGGIAGEDTAVPMALTMMITSLASLVCFVAVRRYVARHPHLEHAFAARPGQGPAQSSSSAMSSTGSSR